MPASKIGNMPYHLLPLLPAYAMVFSSLLQWPRSRPLEPPWAFRGALALAVAFVVIGLLRSMAASYAICGWSLFNPLIARPGLDEIKQVCERVSRRDDGHGLWDGRNLPLDLLPPGSRFPWSTLPY